jgi:fibronectin-binding autotransporter adhesin
MTWSGGQPYFNTINANGGASITGGGTIYGATLNLGADSTWSNNNLPLYHVGTLVIKPGATLETTHNANMTDAGGAGARSFVNQGTFTKHTGTGVTQIGVPFTNSGTVNINSGTLALSGTVTEHSGSTITDGTWNVTNGASISRTAGSNITTIGSEASVNLDGAGSSFAKVTTALTTNQGSFTLKNNRDLTTAGTYANSGTTRVEDSTTVMTIGTGGASAYTQTAGETVLVGGAMIDASVFNLNGGELKGTGIIDSSVVTGGTNTIAPGLSPGALTIEGNLTLSAGSTLDMEIGGLTQGTLYDYLDVNGTLTLAGLLNLSFLNDFQNSLGMGSLFTLATSDAAVLGSFSNVANGGFLTDMASLHTFSVHYGAGSLYNPNNVVLYAVTPEPGRAVLLMLGLLGLTLRRKRHACAVDSALV